jgi:hypothetical protein
MLDKRPLPILQIAAGAWLLAAAGCASSPDVQAVKARERAVTAEGSGIEVTVELRNPNDAPVELTTWDYSVIINDKTAYTGQWVASLTLPPNDRMLAELPAFVPASFGDITGAEWRVGGQLTYRATGKLDKLLYQLGVNHLSTNFGTGGTGIEKVAVVATPAPTPEAPKAEVTKPEAPKPQEPQPQEPQPAAPK